MLTPGESGIRIREPSARAKALTDGFLMGKDDQKTADGSQRFRVKERADRDRRKSNQIRFQITAKVNPFLASMRAATRATAYALGKQLADDYYTKHPKTESQRSDLNNVAPIEGKQKMQDKQHHWGSTIFGVAALVVALVYVGFVVYTTNAVPSVVDFLGLIAGLLAAVGGYLYKGKGNGSVGTGVVLFALMIGMVGCATVELHPSKRLRDMVRNGDVLDKTMMGASQAGQLPPGVFKSYHKISKAFRTKNIEGLKTLLQGRSLETNFFTDQQELMGEMILKELELILLERTKDNGNRSSNIGVSVPGYTGAWSRNTTPNANGGRCTTGRKAFNQSRYRIHYLGHAEGASQYGRRIGKGRSARESAAC